MTPEEAELELAEAEAAAQQPSMATDRLPEQPPERGIGEPTPEESRWGKIVSFMSGSPLFGTVADAAGAIGVGGQGGQGLRREAQRATEQFSPKVAGVPVLPTLGGAVATLPAGATSIVRAGVPMGARAAMATRVGMQGALGGVEAVDKGGGVGDAALGVGAGLVGGAAGEGASIGLGKLAGAARQPLRDVAESQAVKSLLGGGQIVNRVKSQLGVRAEPQMQALGRQVLDEGLLTSGVGIPQTTVGINENVKRMLTREGGIIGQGVEEWDRLAAEEAKKALAQGMPSWTRPDTSSARQAFDAAATHEAQKTGTAMQSLKDVIGVGSALEEPNVNTMRRAWDTKTQLGNQAFAPGTARVTEKAKMLRAGQQAAARDLERQLEGRIGPDMMSEVKDASRRYSLGKRIEGVVEDAATREMGKSGPGLKDYAAAETVGLTGAPGFAAAMLAKTVRGRGNATLAVGADALSRALPTIGGVGAGPVPKAATAETARQSIADPMGALRQYLGLSPDERRKRDAEAFMEGQ